MDRFSGSRSGGAESGRVADRPQFRKMLDEASRPNEPFHEILV